jgi:hypothetical protein
VRTSILLVAAILFVAGAASASLLQWQVKCGLGENLYPFGNDFSTRFGVMADSNWKYDVNDAAHPPVIDPVHDLAFIYSKNYYQVYRDQILHDAGPFHWDAPVGWPPPYGRHEAGVPDYPSPGLLKDTRMPILTAGEPEIWQVTAYAPLGPNNYDDLGNPYNEVCSFIWEWNMPDQEDFWVPDGMQIQVWGNPELESAGIYGDLILNEYGPGRHVIPGIVQWGLNEEGDAAVSKKWIIQATLIPEPAVGQLAGLVFGIAGLGIARFRRK